VVQHRAPAALRAGGSFALPADWRGWADWSAYTNGEHICFDGGKDGCLRICHNCFDRKLGPMLNER
jgi:hypothetical protein